MTKQTSEIEFAAVVPFILMMRKFTKSDSYQNQSDESMLCFATSFYQYTTKAFPFGFVMIQYKTLAVHVDLICSGNGLVQNISLLTIFIQVNKLGIIIVHAFKK